MTTKFDQAGIQFNPHNGFTPNSTGRIRPASISMDLHPIRPVEFDWALITGQIGWKFTEITLYACLVKLGIISVNLTGIYLNGFTPNLTGRIRPGINYWSN